MNEIRNILRESVNRLFSDALDWETLSSIEENGWPEELWRQVTEQGIHLVLADEASGGMQGVWADAYPIIRACGQHAVPLPIPEAIVASWLAQQAGYTLPDGVPGLIPQPLTSKNFTAGKITLGEMVVPWGRNATYLVGLSSAQEGSELIVALTKDTSCKEAYNLGLDPRDEFTSPLPILARLPIDVEIDVVHWLGAMIRAAQIAGAGATCLELAVNYSCEREQFGKTLSRFQVIQHHLANLAGTMASVDAMSAAAFQTLDRLGMSNQRRDARFEIAAAKCRASEGVDKLTGLSHQVHGAIGFTYEYGLHFFTRKLWAWRAEFGGVAEWGEYLGRVACDRGGEKIWHTITE